MKIWACWSSPLSKSRNAWTQIKNVNGASQLSNFWNLLGVIQTISYRDWWPWMKPGHDAMTQRQRNNQWSGGIAAHPAQKNSECKIRRKSSCLNFLGLRWYSSYWLSSEGWSITHLCWCNWPTFWRKNTVGRSPMGGLVLAQCLSSPGTCNPEETGLPGLPLSSLPTLISRSGPVGLPCVSWTEKTFERPHFSSDKEVIAAVETWLDGQPAHFFFFFFELPAEVRTTG
jgi:hypothetical protein